MIEVITKSSLRAKAQDKLAKGAFIKPEDMCDITNVCLGGDFATLENDAKFKLINRSKSHGFGMKGVDVLNKYGSAFDVPVFCKTANKQMSVREMVQAGIFQNAKASSTNTLIEDWSLLWDAMRIDLSIRKAAEPTIRQNFYNEISMPNSDKIFKSVEFYPYAFEFTENNGEGQAVVQGESMGGGYEDIENIIYATGFTWTLLAELFDKSLDFQKISDGVMIAYNAKKDDLAISPILNATYAGAKTTAASTVGSLRQELLYNTLVDAVDDLGVRVDPVTNREIDPMGSIILAHPFDARHIADVLTGLPSVNERRYPALSAVSNVVGYDGEVITGRAKTVTYSGVTKGEAYLIKPNRYMNIGIKRNLTLEVDSMPDVSTLAREKRAWYFVEGMQTTGISSFIQKITLPTW